MINEERVLKEFIELVRIDSPTMHERAVADVLLRKLADLGLEVFEDNAGEALHTDTGNIIGRLAGNVNSLPTVVFCAHMDTVEPGRGVQPVVKDGVVYSAGDTILGSDDKAGIVAILELLRVLQEQKLPHGDIEVVFTVAEEVGLKGVQNLDFGLLKAKMGFVLDCSGSAGTIITRAPAQYRIVATVFGKAAHAGISPEEGINAILVASKAIAKMELGRIDEETTANIGIIEGGKATNIIPDMVNIEGETRSINPAKLEAQTALMCRILEETAAEHNASVRIVKEFLYPALKLTANDQVVQVAMTAARALNLEPQLVSTGGGSDANIFNDAGIPTANLGIGMCKVHSTDEYIPVRDLVLNARYLLEMMQVLAMVKTAV